MRDEADVRFIDPHTERDGGADDEAFLAQEACLILPPLRRVEPGVIGQRGDALALQKLRCLFRLLPAQAVDDSRIAFVARPQEREELIAPRVLERDLVL